MMTTVLVVEDELLVQQTLCPFLERHGFAARQATTVEAALKILGREHVDAVILDLRLHDPEGSERSGLSLLAYLRSRPEYETLPVLIFTGKTLTPADEGLIRRYRADVFQKPQPYTVLVEQLNRSTHAPPLLPAA